MGERAVKHDSMFTVCLGVVAIQSMLEHALPLTLFVKMAKNCSNSASGRVAVMH